jgi:hypothetical protein
VPPRTQLSPGCCHLWHLLPVKRLALLLGLKSPVSGPMIVSGKTPPFCQLFDKTQCCIWHSGFPREVFRVSFLSSTLYLFMSRSFPRAIDVFLLRIHHSMTNRFLCAGIDIAAVHLVKAMRSFKGSDGTIYSRRREAFAMGKRLFTERPSPVA